MKPARQRVLVVDDEPDLAESCAFFLERAGYEAECVHAAQDALDVLERRPCDVVVSDVRMPRMSGMQLLTAIRDRDPDVEVLLITGYPDLQMAVTAIKQGAFDYLAKPYAEHDLIERVGKAMAQRRVKERNEGFRERMRSGVAGRRLMHTSAAFGAAVEMLERAARTDASVLLIGESGTGKELLAHHLHDSSARAGKPFVPVDCAAVPAELFENKLFRSDRCAEQASLWIVQRSELSSTIDGIVETTKRIHQTDLHGVLTTPNPPTSDRINSVNIHISTGGDQTNKILVDVANEALNDAFTRRLYAGIEARDCRQFCGFDAINADLGPTIKALEGGEGSEDPNASGEGGSLRPDLIRVRRNVVATRRRKRSHGDHKGQVSLLDFK